MNPLTSSAAAKAAIKVKGLSFKFKEQPEEVLSDISFEIPVNACAVLLGPNGAGKSTLLSLLSKLIDGGTEGAISFPAFEFFKKNFLSYGTQKSALYDDLSVLENLEFFSRLMEPDKDPSQNIAQLAEQLDIKKFLHRRVSELSGGMRQRAHVAVTLLSDFPLIVLDEPFNNIDPESRVLISKALRETLQKRKATLLISSHQFEAIEDLWTHLIFIKNGKLTEFLEKDSNVNSQKLHKLFEELK